MVPRFARPAAMVSSPQGEALLADALSAVDTLDNALALEQVRGHTGRAVGTQLKYSVALLACAARLIALLS